jgi:hypothetical protein
MVCFFPGPVGFIPLGGAIRTLPDGTRADHRCVQADSLTEEQVSEYKEAFSLFVSVLSPRFQLQRELT